MHILSDDYKLVDICKTGFEKVPRGTFVSSNTKIALDYHAELCNLKINDDVKIDLHLAEKPNVDKKVYLMRGVVYKIDENGFQASFGGLLLFYEGDLNTSLGIGSSIYISLSKNY